MKQHRIQREKRRRNIKKKSVMFSSLALQSHLGSSPQYVLLFQVALGKTLVLAGLTRLRSLLIPEIPKGFPKAGLFRCVASSRNDSTNAPRA